MIQTPGSLLSGKLTQKIHLESSHRSTPDASQRDHCPDVLVLPLVGLRLQEVEHHRRPHAVAEQDHLAVAVVGVSGLDQGRHVLEIIELFV